MYNATLKHGDIYILAGVKYVNGKSVVVDEATKQHLETYAVDKALHPTTKEPMDVPKFVFSPVGRASAPATVSTPSPVVTDADEADMDDSAPAAPVVSGRPKAR
jgi:hypothetical protein